MHSEWLAKGEMGIQTDHIHMIVPIKPNDGISGVVHIMKGGASLCMIWSGARLGGALTKGWT